MRSPKQVSPVRVRSSGARYWAQVSVPLRLVLVPWLLVATMISAQPAGSRPSQAPAGIATFAPLDDSSGQDSTRGHAKALYDQALEAYRQGQFQAAVDHLLKAQKLVPSPALSYDIGLSYAAMGDAPNALAWLRKYLREAPEAPDVAVVQTRVRELERVLQSRGVQQVTLLSQPSNATLVVDERTVGATPLTIELAPGRHRLRVALAGYSREERVFDLGPEHSTDVLVQLTPEPGRAGNALPSAARASVAPRTVPARPEQPPSGAGWNRTRIWSSVAVGAGIAVLGGAVAFELARSGAETDARSASQLEYQTAYDEMRQRQTTARVLAIAGTVLVASGATVLVLDLSRNTSTVQPTAVGVCGAAACAAVRGNF